MAFIKVSTEAEELTAHLGNEHLDLFDTKCIAAIYSQFFIFLIAILERLDEITKTFPYGEWLISNVSHITYF